MADTAVRTRTPLRGGTGAWVVAALVVLLLATRQTSVVPFSLGQTPATLIGFGCFGVAFLCWLAGQDLPSPHRPTVVLVLVQLLTTLAASSALVLRSATDAQITASILVLVRESWLVALVVFVLLVVRSVDGWIVVVQGVVIGATISGVVALIAVGTGVDLGPTLALPGLTDQGSVLSSALERAGGVRPQGMAGHPLELSAVLTVAFPMAVSLMIGERMRGGRWWIWGAASTILLVAAVATISRSAIVGMVAALVVMAWRWPAKQVAVALLTAVAGIAAAVVVGVPMITRLAEVVTGGSDDNSLGSRANGIDYALSVLPDHPWFGQGAGTYDPAVQPVLDNQYLTRLVEAGVVGLLGLLVLLAGAWCMAAMARRRFLDSGRTAEAEIANGVLGALTAVAVIGLILDIPGFAQISSLQVILVALAGAALFVSSDRADA